MTHDENSSSPDPHRPGKGRDKKEELRQELEAVLALVCRSGFHGNASVEVIVQDGIIQHVCKSITQRKQ